MSSQQVQSADSAPPAEATEADVPAGFSIEDIPGVSLTEVLRIDIPKEITDRVETTLPAESNKGGRPPAEFSDEVRDKIIEAILTGLSLAQIGEKDGFPSTKTISRWRLRNQEFNDQVHEAVRQSIFSCEDRALGTADEIDLPTIDNLGVVDAQIHRAEYRKDTFFEMADRRKGDLAKMSKGAGDDAKVIEASFEVIQTADDPRFAEAIARFEKKTGVDSKLYEQPETKP